LVAASRVRRLLQLARRSDKWLSRTRRPWSRRVLVNARTPMNYATLAPVVEILQKDPRIELFFTSSELPARMGEVFVDAKPPFRFINPLAAALHRFDAYLAADFTWVRLPRGAPRVQTFHGVAGKYRSIYEDPARGAHNWDRYFFINRRRMHRYLSSGTIPDWFASARLVGMPRVDCLVDGSLKRDVILAEHGIDPARKTVLYAPTWSPYSSLNVMGEELITRLGAAGFAVIAKLHDRSRDPRFINSGGCDWGARLEPALRATGGLLATGTNASRFMAAGDVLVTDHSSVGFEYLLLDRPVVRIDLPDLIAKTDIEPSYVDLLASASTSVVRSDQAVAAVQRALEDPGRLSQERRAVAGEMFHRPGTATDRAVCFMYEVIELDPPEGATTGTLLRVS
jgi:CDP-glycerol glycerophosphotransferase (TagB/SpsB family)